jgi:O-antigen/teichoic acid export membrane protein
MTDINKISQNVFSLFIGKSIELAISLISITFIARYLGVESYGLFISIVTLTLLLSKIIDFGFAPIVFRENSKSNRSGFIINTAFTIRFISFFLLVILFNAISSFTNLSGKEIFLSNILFLNIIISAKYMNFRELMEIDFKVKHNMFFVMIFNVIDSIVLLILVFVMPIIKGQIVYVASIYVLSNLPGFIGLIILLRKKYGFSFKFSLSDSKWLVRESWPLYGTVLFIALYQQADILFLSTLDTTYAVGIYGAATRLTSPLTIIPLALITTIFPILVKSMEQSEPGKSTFKLNILVFKILFFFSLCFSLIISFKAKEFILIVLGAEYYEAYLPLIILFWSYLFVYFNTFAQNILTAYRHQKFNFFFTLILVASNFILIILLISNYSFIGVSVAKLLASMLGTLFLVKVLNKTAIKFNFFSREVIFWIFWMVILVIILSFLPLYLYLLLSSLFIPIITLKISYFSFEELNSILNIITKKSWKEKILKNI